MPILAVRCGFAIAALVVGCVFCPRSVAHNALPPAGQTAPELQLAQLLQAPPGTRPSLAAMRGKAIVLEFWATWCGGCVAAIPHLNELAEQFKHKPVIFLSVTGEGADVVQAFLKERPMESWIGIDEDGATFRKYGIEGRPQAVLIDASGILRAPILPERLDSVVIDKLVSGAAIPDETKLNTPFFRPMELKQGAPPPLLKILIRPAARASVSGFSPGAVWQGTDGTIEYFGMNLRKLLAYSWYLREDRILAPEWFDQNRYDLATVIPKGMDESRNGLIQEVLAATFQLHTRVEARATSVYVLSTAPGSSGKLHVSSAQPSPGFTAHPGQFTGIATSLSRLTHALNSEIDRSEVIDETG